ncbi:MAG: ATP-binding protein [Acidimicrobiales bacterium]
MSWSSGKDSTLALHRARSAGDLNVVGLMTTLNSQADRVAMHAVRRQLLEAQAASLGLPVHVIELPWPCSNEAYEEIMSAAVAAAVEAGVEHVVFGDLYLEDVRQYRERVLAGTGLSPVFPLWRAPTRELALEMISCGIRAVITCVDPSQAPREIAGRWYDEALIAELPSSVDPCGENGEFHTFVIDGPGFAHRLGVSLGEIVERDGFVFADVLAATSPDTSSRHSDA